MIVFSASDNLENGFISSTRSIKSAVCGITTSVTASVMVSIASVDGSGTNELFKVGKTVSLIRDSFKFVFISSLSNRTTFFLYPHLLLELSDSYELAILPLVPPNDSFVHKLQHYKIKPNKQLMDQRQKLLLK